MKDELKNAIWADLEPWIDLDLARAKSSPKRGGRRLTDRLRTRAAVLLAAAVAVAAPGVALASGAFSNATPESVAASMPRGTILLGRSDPTCTAMGDAGAFRCVLAQPPTPYTGPGLTPQEAATIVEAPPGGTLAPVDRAADEAELESYGWTGPQIAEFIDSPLHIWADEYLGIKEVTLDANDEVNGGCISISKDGSTWECFAGEAAVEHHVIDASLLGKYQAQPEF